MTKSQLETIKRIKRYVDEPINGNIAVVDTKDLKVILDLIEKLGGKTNDNKKDNSTGNLLK